MSFKKNSSAFVVTLLLSHAVLAPLTVIAQEQDASPQQVQEKNNSSLNESVSKNSSETSGDTSQDSVAQESNQTVTENIDMSEVPDESVDSELVSGDVSTSSETANETTSKAVSGNWEYTDKGTYCVITGYSGTEKDWVVPNEINGKPTKITQDVFAKMDNVVRVVNVGKEELEQTKGHLIYKKSTYIYNAVPTKILENFPDIIPNVKREPNVCYIGSLHAAKGFQYLAMAWPVVLKEIPKAQLYVIGSGKLYGRNNKLGKWNIASEEFEEMFMPYLTEHGKIIPSVHFLGILGEEKYNVLEKCKVGVPNPSGVSETFGYTAVEMEFMDCQVTTIKCPGYMDTVCQKENLYENTNELSQYIIRLLKNNNYDRNKESHLMKNSEWGAVAYLTESKYGRNGTAVTRNTSSSYYTAGASGATATTNPLQSTTGNEYGIFDTVGGAWEYAAGYVADSSNSYGNSFASTDDTTNNKEESTKYATVYRMANSNIYKDNYIVNINKIFGDATTETSTSGSGITSWHSADSYFVGILWRQRLSVLLAWGQLWRHQCRFILLPRPWRWLQLLQFPCVFCSKVM